MDSIQKVRSITLWIFIVPFVAINTCLILITQFHGLFNPEDIILNTIPYIDGGASISRTARVFPTYLIFKPAMFLTSFLLILYWLNVKNIINHFKSRPQEVFKFLPKLIESKILIATFANINPSGIQGVIKIKIIFALYYITLFTWFNDENESLEKTMSVLDKYLNNIEKFIKF